MSDDRVRFPGLDGLRAVAALSVVVVHVEQLKILFGMAPGDELFLPAHLVLRGHDAVRLFFVLSGFLITYLLLVERERRGTVDVPAFWIRRALRIWPLYGATAAIAFAVLPLAAWGLGALPSPAPLRFGLAGIEARPAGLRPGEIAAVLLFVTNFVPVWIVGAGHLWSVACEEQFYATWPLVLRRLGGRLVPVLAGIVAVKLALRLALEAWEAGGPPGAIRSGVVLFEVEAMAIGALAAEALFRDRRRLLAVARHRAVEAGALAWLFAERHVLPDGGAGGPVLGAVAGAIVVLAVATKERPLVRLDGALPRFLGRISYGIYMLHPAVVALLLLVARAAGVARIESSAASTLLLAASLGGTVAAAATSWRVLERPFLDRKERFARVRSGAPPVSGLAAGGA